MNLSDKIESPPENSPYPDGPGYAWPESYYMEKNPAKRLALLNEALSSDSPSAEDGIRKRIFDMRYTPNKYGEGGYADMFMRVFMNFSDISKNGPSRFGISRGKKHVLKDLKTLGLGSDNDEQFNSLLFDEFVHVGRLYIALSADSKQYRAVFLGFGRLKDADLAQKLHGDLAAAGKDIAEMFSLQKEMKLWIDGLELARSEMLPGTEPLV